MKTRLCLIGIGLLLAAGCQQSTKSESQPSALDVTPTAQPMPMAQAAAQPMPVETTATPAISASVAPAGDRYTVKPGDTLWRIAASPLRRRQEVEADE